jgi:serine/threonine-protein kinase
MSTDPRQEPGTLPLSLARHVDALCCHFEAGWKNASAARERPCIEDYLRDVPEPAHSTLVQELVLLDAYYRRRSGEVPQVEEYRRRFPDLPPQFQLEAPPGSPFQATPALTASPDGHTLPVWAGETGRYQLSGEITRGGMGAILQGRDLLLGRELAVKVLLDAHRCDPSLVRRFHEEAQIGGQLQHPGIVPVYDLAQFADGRPFFTMKLVKGRTLAALLADRAHPGQDLPRLLGIFAQVCQTVAYAHSKGVIHRDLKPANVMVGAFGEVQVMDWGLAKVLGDRAAPGTAPTPPDQAEPSAIRTVRTEAVAESEAGTVLGTFAYMAPEQARGAVDQLDQRCDVFGLGAILCEVLTGKPPYTAATREAVHLQAVQGDLTDARARLDACGTDEELLRLARRCLAARPEDRPRDAVELAAEVTAYREGVEARLRQAELERAAAEARAREERKRRRVQLALAVMMLLLVGVATIGAWLWQQQRQARVAEAARRQQETDGVVAAALHEAGLLRKQAKEAPLGDGGKYREALAAARKAGELARAGEASEGVRGQATDLIAELEQEAAAAERDRVLLVALLEVRNPREGRHFRADAKGVLTELAEPSADEQFGAAFRAWGLDVDGTPTADAAARFQGRPAAVVTEVIAALDEWASERRRQRRPAAERQRLAGLAKALEGVSSSQRGKLRAILERGHLPVERALGVLGAALRPVPIPFDAGPGVDRGRLRQLVEKTDPSTEPVLGLLTLARALWEAGDEAVAERLLRAAVRARPREVVLHDTLGKLLAEQSPPRWAEAVECHAAARALRPDLGVSLARSLVGSGRVGEGLALFERLTVEQPANPWTHFARGFSLADQGRFQEAEKSYRAALRRKPDIPEVHSNLGSVLAAQGRLPEAKASFREAIRLKPNSSRSHSHLGIVLYDQGRYQEAEASFRQAIQHRRASHFAHYNLGNALWSQGRLQEAETSYRAAIRLKHDFPQAHSNLGVVLQSQGRFQEAEKSHREAIRLKPDAAQAHTNLGIFLRDQRRYKEAEASFREVIRLKPDDPAAHGNLGNALGGQGRLPEAEAAFRQAIRLKPDDPDGHRNLASTLGRQGRYKEAEASFRQAIRLKPDDPEVHRHLGLALSAQGRDQEAESSFRQAIALDPRNAFAHSNLGTVLYRKGQVDEAIRCLQKAIQLDPRLVLVYGKLGEALLRQGRFAEAQASTRRFLDLLPEGHSLRKQAYGQLEECRRWLALEKQLPAILEGKAKPADARQHLAFAHLCALKKRHVAAARLYAGAFTAEPKWADDLRSSHRYNAACAAALACAGKGEEGANLDDKERVHLRRQALTWLRADLAAWCKVVDTGRSQALPVVQQALHHWQKDPDLAGLRDPEALARLPEAERQACRQLWADVSVLLKRAQHQAKPVPQEKAPDQSKP